jgi:translation initiation factor 1
VRRETKGRRGKTITRVSGLPLAGAALKDLARRLKQRCGVGGGMEGADVIIQGDKVEQVLAVLAAEGYPAKRAGG